jgi:hypothetical protein
MVSFNDFTAANLSVSLSELSGARGGAPSKGFYHAQVLDVSGGKVVLNIDGKTVVADSEVPLSPGSEFDLTVKGYDSNGRVQLQVTGMRDSVEAPVRPLTDTMISSRLIGFDLPDHPATVESARALMRLGVAVTKANLETMLMALPKNADAKTIEFAVAVLKEGLPLSRELIRALPTITRNLDALPDNMKAAGDAVLRAAQQNQQAATFVRVDSGIDPEALLTLLPPPAENADQIAEQIPNFIRGFLHSTEARLQALTESGLAQTPGADARASFIDQLITILKLIPETPPADTSTIERAIGSIANRANSIAFSENDESAFAPLRAGLNQAVAQSLELQSPPARLEAVRNSVELILAQALGLDTEAPPETGAASYPSIFSPALTALPGQLDGAAADFAKILQQLQNYQNTPQGEQQAAPVAREQIIAAAARLAPLLNFKFDSEATPQIKEFVDAASRLTQEALKAAADPKEQNAAQRPASNPDAAAATERLRAVLDSPAFRREIEFLGRNFNNLPDVRMALARSESSQDMPLHVLRDLAQGLQSANIANLVRHTGAAPLDSFVTFFPIQVGDHVEIGKLKVFRREEDARGDKEKKSFKPLNPFDAHLVIILDTEFLGLTQISLRTFPNKGIKCDIEVQDNRRHRITEKYADELREGLKNTAYEQNTVSVSVRRRRQDGANETPPGAHQVSMVDFRI